MAPKYQVRQSSLLEPHAFSKSKKSWKYISLQPYIPKTSIKIHLSSSVPASKGHSSPWTRWRSRCPRAALAPRPAGGGLRPRHLKAKFSSNCAKKKELYVKVCDNCWNLI